MALFQTVHQLFPQGNEVEIRFGRIVGGQFSSRLTFLQFAKIYTNLKSKYSDRMTHVHQMDYIKGNHRLTVTSDGKETLLKKSKRVKQDFQAKGLAFDVRVSACTEELFPISADLRVSAMDSPDMVREKDRATFQMDGFAIDVTVVNVHHAKGVVKGDEEIAVTSYEVEIEIFKDESIEEAVSMIFLFLKWIGETSETEIGVHSFVKYLNYLK